jgi:hypothetical protein
MQNPSALETGCVGCFGAVTIIQNPFLEWSGARDNDSDTQPPHSHPRVPFCRGLETVVKTNDRSKIKRVVAGVRGLERCGVEVAMV